MTKDEQIASLTIQNKVLQNNLILLFKEVSIPSPLSLLEESPAKFVAAHNKQVILNAVNEHYEKGNVIALSLIDYAEQEYGEGK